MAKKNGPTFQKREKEKARVMKQREKEERRIESKERRADMPVGIGDEDPDIAGIRPGPQPLPEQWHHEHLSRLEPRNEPAGDDV